LPRCRLESNGPQHPNVDDRRKSPLGKQQSEIIPEFFRNISGGTMTKLRRNCLLVLAMAVLTVIVATPLVFAQTKQGVDLFDSWKFQDAEKVLSEALKTNPQDVQAAYYLGLSLLMQDKHSEALEILLKAQASQAKAGQGRPAVPDEYQIRIALARTYLELKQNEDAWKHLEEANKIHAGAIEVCIYRGAYYLNKEKYPQAIKELEKAMKLDDNNAYAHYYAGYAYLRSGNPAKALDMFRSFIQLAPNAPEAVKVKTLVDALC
jgi:tetratricopeptide (TPR) repeat protein